MSQRKIIAVVGATGAQGGGLVRAILEDPESRFAVRAITRKPDSDRGRALAAAGAEVVAADIDAPESVRRAFAGAYGAFCVTNFWEHLSPEREKEQAVAMARATRAAGVRHVVWSTLEDTRRDIPLDDPRMPVLRGKYNVPHFDAKGEADEIFAAEAAPTSYLLAAFYWDNFIHFGMAPRPGEHGDLVLALPLGGQKLPGIAAGDIGHCAYGIFKRGEAAIGERFGIAGDVLSGPEMAAAFAVALERPVHFYDVPFDVYRAFGFPGADDLGNMFQYQALHGDAFLDSRDVAVSRALYPGLQDFATWLRANAEHLPLGG
jgi:uncharacterized protein YbjT (DUF2867 family)